MKGIVLAAGEGRRINQITYGAIPKELLPIGNIPAIRFPIESIRLTGTKHIIVVIAPLTKHSVVDALQNGNIVGLNICYAVQRKVGRRSRGIGAAILAAKPWIDETEDFIVACGDSIFCNLLSECPLDFLKTLLAVHERLKPLATLLTFTGLARPNRYGVVKFSRLKANEGFMFGDVCEVKEKPTRKELEDFSIDENNGKMLVNIITGYYAFSPKIFNYVEETEIGKNREIQITDSIRIAIESNEKICAILFNRERNPQYWDVGIPGDYKQANRVLSQSHSRFLVGRR